MDTTLRDFIVSQIEKMPSGEKGKFLSTLKKSPEIVVHTMIANMETWALAAAFNTGKVIMVPDVKGNSEEIIDYFKQHFSKELATIK
jgi:hypothetical protein